MKLKSIAAAAAACALTIGLAGCSEDGGDRSRGDIPVAPGPAPTTQGAAPAPAPTAAPTAEDTQDPVTAAPGTDDPYGQDPSGATLTIGDETIPVSYLSCWSFDESTSLSISGSNAAGEDRTLSVNTDGGFIHYIGLDEWFTRLGEWGDQYLENNPTVSVAGDNWTVDGTVRLTDGSTVPVSATLTCAVNEAYDGTEDTDFVAPDLVVSQSYEVGHLLAATTSQITVDGVAVPTMAAPQCDVYDDGYQNIGIDGIMEDGGTIGVTMTWYGLGRAPSIDADISSPNGDFFWYYWSEGYSEDNPPVIAVSGSTYVIGGIFDDGTASHEITAAIVCP